MSWFISALIVVLLIDVVTIFVLLWIARNGPLVDENPAEHRHDDRRVPRDLFVLALAVLLAACAPASAAQQQPQRPCGPHDHITGQLDDRYSEEVRSLGLQSNGHVIQVYASATGATWTIVSTRPDGVACIVASGKWWQELPRDLPIGMAR